MLSSAVRLLPTPTARDYRNPNSQESQEKRHAGYRRKKGQQLPNEIGGQLNPDWVEWLMGWPIGWTALDPLPPTRFKEWTEMTMAGTWWRQEPDNIPRVATGIKNRIGRLKALGNGQVPLCAATAWLTIAPAAWSRASSRLLPIMADGREEAR